LVGAFGNSTWRGSITFDTPPNNLGQVVQTRFTTGSSLDTNITTIVYLLKDLSGWVFGDKGYLMNSDRRCGS
jgi:hypothetical protein